MQNSSIEYTKYFNVSKLEDTEQSKSIFYSIFKKFIITHFIILLKSYSQLLNNKDYFLNASADTYSNIKTNDFIEPFLTNKLINIFYLSNTIRRDNKYIQFITQLRTEIETSIGVDNDILKNVGKHIVDSFTYNSSNSDNNSINYETFISLLKILYILLDYNKFNYITFEDFQLKMTNYINSLYNSDLKEKNVEEYKGYNNNNNTEQFIPSNEDLKNISQYKFLQELINTYLESLTLYCNNGNYIETTNCITHYIEFNDINKINDNNDQLISMFVFIPADKQRTKNNNNVTNNVILKHFFIIKDILNYVLYELKIKKGKIIKYASIILHSYCSYYFKESFFITTPKLNMKSIFLNYMKYNNTVKILNDIELLNNIDLLSIHENNKTYNDNNDKLFLSDLKLNMPDINKLLYDDIIYLRKSCEFTRSSAYNGQMLFNVIHFREDWIKLIREYLNTPLKGGLYKYKKNRKAQITKKYKSKFNKSKFNKSNINKSKFK